MRRVLLDFLLSYNKDTNMKIAAIYWSTSSVGGINTTTSHLRKAAAKTGDVFDVIWSAPWKTKSQERYPGPIDVRGGDTYMTIEGHASHHPDHIAKTIRWLEENYDSVFFCFLCPHPTKAYGDLPLFLPLFTKLKLPKVAIITDGYWDSYAAWGARCLDHLKAALVINATYAQPLLDAGYNVEAVRTPLFPSPVPEVARSKGPLTVWTSQQKAIKGFHRFLPTIPDIKGTVEMYSCGIMYYQLRTEPAWYNAVGKNLMHPEFGGRGKCTYFGNVPLTSIPEILSRAWFMVDLQGSGRPKNKVYQQGSYNYTTVEALYYGACPVLDKQALLSDIPHDLFLTVDDAGDIPKLLNSKAARAFALDPKRQKKARAYIKKHHDINVTFEKIKAAFAS